jgi:hypothetical protein
MIETLVRTPKPGDRVRYRDPDGDREGPALVADAEGGGLAPGEVHLDSRPDLLSYDYRSKVPHGDVRTQAGVWSWPDEVGKGEGQSRWAG